MNGRIRELADQILPNEKEFHQGDPREWGYFFSGEELEKFALLIVRELVSKLEVEGSDVYHNESNDWGAIKIKHFVDGDPNQMLGEEVMAQYANGTVKGSGRYRLNDKFVQHLVKQCFGDE